MIFLPEPRGKEVSDVCELVCLKILFCGLITIHLLESIHTREKTRVISIMLVRSLHLYPEELLSSGYFPCMFSSRTIPRRALCLSRGLSLEELSCLSLEDYTSRSLHASLEDYHSRSLHASLEDYPSRSLPAALEELTPRGAYSRPLSRGA